MSSFFSKLEGSVKDRVGQGSNVSQALTNPLAFAEKVFGHARQEVIGMLQLTHLVVEERINSCTGIINPNRTITKLCNL
jgi:hypothetical protein